jgi:hypothetical protein
MVIADAKVVFIHDFYLRLWWPRFTNKTLNRRSLAV